MRFWSHTDADFPWVVFPLVGWSIGLTAHYIFGFRRAGGEIRARQTKIEDVARRPHATA